MPQSFRSCIAQTIGYPMQEERLALHVPRMCDIQPVIGIAHEGLVGYQGHVLFKLFLKPGRRGAYGNEGAEKPMSMRPDHCQPEEGQPVTGCGPATEAFVDPFQHCHKSVELRLCFWREEP